MPRPFSSSTLLALVLATSQVAGIAWAGKPDRITDRTARDAVRKGLNKVYGEQRWRVSLSAVESAGTRLFEARGERQAPPKVFGSVKVIKGNKAYRGLSRMMIAGETVYPGRPNTILDSSARRVIRAGLKKVHGETGAWQIYLAGWIAHGDRRPFVAITGDEHAGGKRVDGVVNVGKSNKTYRGLARVTLGPAQEGPVDEE